MAQDFSAQKSKQTLEFRVSGSLGVGLGPDIRLLAVRCCHHVNLKFREGLTNFFLGFSLSGSKVHDKVYSRATAAGKGLCCCKQSARGF